MQAGHTPFVRTRLSAMMFLEFFIWGGWCFAITGYAGETLKFSGPDLGWLMSTTAFGAIIAPLFVGYIADRFFATERMLSVMHLLGGISLIVAAQTTTYWPMFAMMLLNGLFFMPTLALANSLAFRHIPDAAKFPRIAVLGTIGWIMSNLIVTALGGTATNTFFYVSGGGAIVMAVYCLTLPHTPPSGAPTGGAVFGLDALKLLKNPAFLVFAVCAFLVVIPSCPLFFVVLVPMLQERGYPAPLALTTLNQFSEIIFMFTMPMFVVWLGLKRVLGIGMLAWAVRYVCFAAGTFPLAILGLILHGFCYSFLFVGAYMYVDRRAPADLKASAQSLISFLMLGVGWFLGSQAGGQLMGVFPAPVNNMPAFAAADNSPAKEAPLPAWNDPEAAKSAWRYLDLSGTLNQLLGKTTKTEVDLGSLVDKNGNGTITQAELDAIPDAGIQVGKFVYKRDGMIAVFKKIAEVEKLKDAEKNLQLTRQEYRQAQIKDWRSIWLYPAVAIFVIFAVFMFAFQDKELTTQAGAKENG